MNAALLELIRWHLLLPVVAHDDELSTLIEDGRRHDCWRPGSLARAEAFARRDEQSAVGELLRFCDSGWPQIAGKTSCLETLPLALAAAEALSHETWPGAFAPLEEREAFRAVYRRLEAAWHRAQAWSRAQVGAP